MYNDDCGILKCIISRTTNYQFFPLISNCIKNDTEKCKKMRENLLLKFSLKILGSDLKKVNL